MPSASSARPCSQQVAGEVQQIGRVRTRQLERAAEVPFAGGQVIHFRQHQAEQIVAVRALRVDAQRGARHFRGLLQPAVRHEDLHQLVVGPLGARLRPEHRVQRLHRLDALRRAASAPGTEAPAHRRCRHPRQTLRRSRLGAAQVPARERVAAAGDEGVGSGTLMRAYGARFAAGCLGPRRAAAAALTAVCSALHRTAGGRRDAGAHPGPGARSKYRARV